MFSGGGVNVTASSRYVKKSPYAGWTVLAIDPHIAAARGIQQRPSTLVYTAPFSHSRRPDASGRQQCAPAGLNDAELPLHSYRCFHYQSALRRPLEANSFRSANHTRRSARRRRRPRSVTFLFRQFMQPKISPSMR